jgi:ATP-dependent DNA ligase
MNDLPDKMEVARGITMPFYPMRPQPGSPLKTDAQVKSVIDEVDGDRWLIQPKLGGTRAILAVVDKRLCLQNRHGLWLGLAPRNFQDFLKLPDRTCLDGEIVRDEFHPFECLAVKGQSLIFRPTAERATVAFQLVKLIGHQWLFNSPAPKFLKAKRKNLPTWEGVVMKDYMSFYIMLAKETQTSPTWLKRKW